MALWIKDETLKKQSRDFTCVSDHDHHQCCSCIAGILRYTFLMLLYIQRNSLWLRWFFRQLFGLFLGSWGNIEVYQFASSDMNNLRSCYATLDSFRSFFAFDCQYFSFSKSYSSIGTWTIPASGAITILVSKGSACHNYENYQHKFDKSTESLIARVPTWVQPNVLYRWDLHCSWTKYGSCLSLVLLWRLVAFRKLFQLVKTPYISTSPFRLWTVNLDAILHSINQSHSGGRRQATAAEPSMMPPNGSLQVLDASAHRLFTSSSSSIHITWLSQSSTLFNQLTHSHSFQKPNIINPHHQNAIINCCTRPCWLGFRRNINSHWMGWGNSNKLYR